MCVCLRSHTHRTSGSFFVRCQFCEFAACIIYMCMCILYIDIYICVCVCSSILSTHSHSHCIALLASRTHSHRQANKYICKVNYFYIFVVGIVVVSWSCFAATFLACVFVSAQFMLHPLDTHTLIHFLNFQGFLHSDRVCASISVNLQTYIHTHTQVPLYIATRLFTQFMAIFTIFGCNMNFVGL